jgi:hypothetical protein
MRLTVLEFRNRFTQAEKVAIELASLDDPAAALSQRAQAAALRAYQADLLVASYVDLSRADTQAGVHALEQFGLLAPGRALQILSTGEAVPDAPPVGGFVLGQQVRVLPPFDESFPGVHAVEGFAPDAVLVAGTAFAPDYLEAV